jgi:hypothetical protein
MSTAFEPIGAGELGQIFADLGSGSFSVVVAPENEVSSAAEQIARRIGRMGGEPVERIQEPRDALELAKHVRRAREAVLVLSGLDGFSEDEWRRLDERRSQLGRDRRAVLVLSRRGAERLVRAAPHLASWIGSSFREWDDQLLSAADKERRLARLRERTGLDDEQVLALAKGGELPNDPVFAEWLVLLGRGELFERA